MNIYDHSEARASYFGEGNPQQQNAPEPEPTMVLPVPAPPQQQMVPFTGYAPVPNPAAPYGIDTRTGLPLSNKQKSTLVLISFFFGALGVDRMYKGDMGLGILKLLTLGGLGVWALIDFLIFAFGTPKDDQGRVLS